MYKLYDINVALDTLKCFWLLLLLLLLVHTPSFPVYKAYTYIKIQTLSSLTNNLTIKILFL